MMEQTPEKPQMIMERRMGVKQYEEYSKALEKAIDFILVAQVESDTVRARRALEEAAANVGIAERRLKLALTGLNR